MSKKLTTTKFVRKARIVHGEMYCYDNVIYTNSKKKVEIKCRTHGIFLQLPTHHLRGHGCSECANNAVLTTEKFIAKARIISWKFGPLLGNKICSLYLKGGYYM